MLKIIRRVFSFGDFSRSRPNEQIPGDMLDAQFDEIVDRIDDWDRKIRQVVNDAGQIAAGSVDLFALQPQVLLEIEKRLRERLDPAADAAESALRTAEAALNRAQKALSEAESSLTRAKAVSSDVLALQSQAFAKISAANAVSAEILAKTDQLSAESAEIRSDWDDASSQAQAWALSSALWAEHMPDTLPDNAVKIMDISGDHWSARWWANRADNAFGRLTDLYLGAWPDPPTTNLEGGPIQIGSIYYNTEDGQIYVWDGSNWVSMTQPQRAGLATLWYNAAGGQTVFPLTTPDLKGSSFTLTAGAVEGVDAHVNGVKLMPKDIAADGDWTLNAATSTVTFLRPLKAMDLVSFDLLMANTRLGPGMVHAWSLALSEARNGVRTTFTLLMETAGGPAVTVARNEELLVSLDGVIQEPGVSYSSSGASISFTQAPAADSWIFITWFRSDGGTGIIPETDEVVGGIITIAATAPTTPNVNDVWIDVS